MWWGGTNPDEPGEASSPRIVEPEPEASSEGSGSPPVDIMAEEDDDEATRTIGADQDEEDEDSGDDFGELHEQFAAQEKLLGELRGVLKSNEKKLENKEKEYAERMSSHSSYYGSSNLARSASTPIVIPRYDESSADTTGDASSFTRSSKLKLFKKELDEARLKEDEEIREHKNLEHLVKQLQLELAERDKMITSLREDAFSVASMSFAGSPINSPYVMSPERGSPTDMTPNRTPPLGCSLDSAASYSGFSLRSFGDNNRNLELNEKNIELERKIMDLEENLREKDELIRARTQAVTLMSADLSAKGKSTLDQLEETRFEMKKMQTNFAEKEAEWREQMTILKRELVTKDNKLQSMEESFDRLEKTRFDLSTKNASLQEKIVALQSDVADRKRNEQQLILQKEEKEEACAKKILTLERRLELSESSREVSREKFLDEVRGVVSDSELSEKIAQIENQVTELEEEKGNLQLKLVEFEELAAQDARSKQELRHMSEKLSEREELVEQHVRTIEKLESEKSDLYSVIRGLEDDVSNVSHQLSELQSVNQDLSESKVRLELRAVDLEEQRDRAIEEAKELEVTIKNLKTDLQDQAHQYTELKREHSDMVVEYHILESNHSRCQSTQKLFDKDFLEKNLKIKELTISVAQLEKVIEEKNGEIGETLSVLDLKQTECHKALDQVEILQKNVDEKDAKIESLSSLLDESAMNEHLKHLTDQASKLQSKVGILEEEKFDRENEISELRENLQKFENEVSQLRETHEKCETENLQLKEYLSKSELERSAISEQLEAIQEALKTAEANAQDSESQIVQLTNNKNQLNDQLTGTIEEKQQLLEEKLRIEADLTQVRDQISEVERSVIELSVAKSSLEQQLSEMEQMRDEAVKKLADVEANQAAIYIDLENEKQLHTLLQEEHSNMVTDLHKLEHDHSRCSVTKHELKQKLSELEHTVAAQASHLAETSHSLQQTSASVENQLVNARADYENQLSLKSTQLEEARSDYNNQLSSKSALLDEARKEVESLCSRLADSQQETDAKSSLIQNLHIRITELEQEVSNVKVVASPIPDSDNDGWNEDFTGFGTEEVAVADEAFEQGAAAPVQERLVQGAASDELESLRNELALTKSELETLTSKLIKTQQDYEEQVKLVDSLLQQKQGIESSDGLNEDFDAFGADKSDFVETRSQFESVVSKLTAVEQEKEKFFSTVAILKEQLTSLESQAQETGAQCKDAWGDDFDAFGSDQVEKAEYDEIKHQLEETRSQLESVMSKLKIAEEENEKQAAVATALKAQVTSLEIRVTEASSSSKDGWGDDFDGFGIDNAATDEQVSTSALQTELEQSRSVIESLKSKLSQAEQDIEERAQQVARLQDQVTHLETQAQVSTTSANDGWNEDFDAFGTDNVETVTLNAELEELRAESESLKSRLKTAELEKEEHVSLVNKLEARVVELEGQIPEEPSSQDGWNQDFDGFGSGDVALANEPASLSELQSKLEESLQQQSARDDTIRDLEEKISALEDKRSELEASMESKALDDQQVLADLKQQLDEERDKTVQQSAVVSALTEELKSLKKELKTLNQNTSADVGHFQEQIKSLENDVVDKQKELEEEKEMWSRKESSLMNKLKNLESGYNQLVSEQSVDVQTVIAERDRAKTKGDLLTDKCKKFLAKAKQLEAKGKIDEAKLAEAASQIQTLTEELTLIRDEITAKVDVIQSLEFEIGKMREREVYLEEKTAELDTSKGPLLDLQTQVEDLKHKLEQSRASNEELVSEITEKQQAYTDLSAQLDNLVEEHLRKDGLIETLNSEKNQLGREIDLLESLGLDLKSQLENLIAAKFSLEQSAVADVAEKISAIEALRKTLEQNKNEFEKIKSENETIVQELKNEILKKDSQIETIQNASLSNDDVMNKAQMLKDMLEQKEIEYEKIKSENEATIQELKKEIHEKKNVIQQLQTTSADNEALVHEAQELKEQLELAVKEREQLKDENVSIETSRNNLREKVESKDEQIQIQEEQINQLSQALASSRSENAELISKLADLEEEKDDSEKCLEQLQNRVIQMGETLEELKAERSNFEEELRKKQTLLESLQTNSGLQDQVSVHRSQLDEKERMINTLKEQVIDQLEEQLTLLRQELQVRAQDLNSAHNRIVQLESELTERNEQLDQLRNNEDQQQQQPLDLADFNRPPPDVTQYQGVPLHPDVAHHSTVSAQPDIMPSYSFQDEDQQELNTAEHDIPFYQMPDQHQGGDGWNDAAWGDPEDWFAGVQPDNQQQHHHQQHHDQEQHHEQQHYDHQQQYHKQLPELFQQHQHPEQFLPEPAQHAAQADITLDELNILRERLNSNNGELDTLRQTLAVKSEECSKLEQDLSKLKSDSEYLKQALAGKEDECSGLKSNLSQLKVDQDLAQSSYSEKMDSLRAQHIQTLQTLQDDAKVVSQDKEALEAELQISEQECKELRESISQMQERISQMEQRSSQIEVANPVLEPVSVQKNSSQTATEVPVPTFQLPSTTTTAPSSASVQSPTATSYFTWDSGTFGSTDDPFSIGTATALSHPFSAAVSATTTAVQNVQSDFNMFQQQPSSSEISSWPQPQAWPQHQTAYDQQQQHAVYPAWQPNEDYQQRIYDLEQQVAELRSSLDSSDSTRQSLELELPRLKEEKERRIKGLEDQLIFLQTSFDAANLAKQSLEMELSQLPNWSQMDALKEEKEGLEELMTSNQEKIQLLQIKVNELASHLETCSATKNSLEEERNRLIEQISFYENQTRFDSNIAVQSLSDKLANLEAANEELNRQLETYAQNVGNLEEERNRLIQQINQFESQSTHDQVDLREKLSSLETINQDLLRQLEELKASKESLPEQVEEPLLAVANVKTELFSFNDGSDKDQAGTASSYFSQVGSGLETKQEESNPFVPADLFQSSQEFSLPEQQQPVLEVKKKDEALQQQPQQPSEDVTAWYQSELTKYQQAIADWQAWADNQNSQFANLQVTLTQYIEAYNAVAAELAQLQAAHSAQPAEDGSGQKDEEIAKLKASVRAKGIEIEDLMETVDRLRSEKEDLEQEMTDLSQRNEELRANNEVPASNDGQDLEGSDRPDYFSLYQEIKTNYDTLLEQKEQLDREVVIVAKEEMATQKRSCEEDHDHSSLESKLRDAESQVRDAEAKLNDVTAKLTDVDAKYGDAQTFLSLLEKQVKDLTTEKSRLLDRIDTLEEGNERFFEMKQNQDREIELLRSFESDWKRRHDSLQWQLTEMEQQMENQKANLMKSDREQELMNKVSKYSEELTNTMGQNLVLKNNQDACFKEQASLKMEVLGMKHAVNEMEQNCDALKDQLRDAGVMALNLQQEKESLTADYNELKQMFDTANECLEMLQNVQIERDQLSKKVDQLEDQVDKLESENLSLKTKVATYEREAKRPIQEYADFQALNQSLQEEIVSLRSYLADQQSTISELQQHNSPFTSHSTQDAVVSLQRQVHERNVQLVQLQAEIESYKKSRDESDADRENEIRRLFSDPLNTSGSSQDNPEANLSLENDRLKNDLNQSVRENRQLTRQLETWKRQLASFDASSGNQGRVFDDVDIDADDYDDESENSPVVLRLRQEQAYRSVAALQLRVEELTLEVTKLLEERDTLQLKLSNVMRQFERQKESASRASTARSTPVPWMPYVDSAAEVRELRMKIEELGKLNYALDIELQKERDSRNLMQARLTGTPRRTLEQRRLESSSSQEHSSPGGVIHL